MRKGTKYKGYIIHYGSSYSLCLGDWYITKEGHFSYLLKDLSMGSSMSISNPLLNGWRDSLSICKRDIDKITGGIKNVIGGTIL